MTNDEIISKNKELIKKYPWLMPRNRFSDKIADDYDYSYTELDAMPSGWQKAFGEQMCEEIQTELEKFNYVNKFRITQIKEKFGELRIYINAAPIGDLSEVDKTVILDDWKDHPVEENKDDYWKYCGLTEDGKFKFEHYKILSKCHIYDIIDKYTELSTRICIKCGKPATKISQGWISPWCDDCTNDKCMYIPIDEYFDKTIDEIE